jgi:hypothetical protein
VAAVPALTLARPEAITATGLLDIVEAVMHASRSEWHFFRELRVPTGRRVVDAQRLDAFALNAYQHMSMKRIAYEVKISRSDFLSELKRPIKRRIGMRYSNEFYFVTPGGLLDVGEVPCECGLIEAGHATAEEWQRLLKRSAGFFHFDPVTRSYCMVTVPAPWRDTPGPTWQITAAMLRNQRRELEEKPPAPPDQQRLTFE